MAKVSFSKDGAVEAEVISQTVSAPGVPDVAIPTTTTVAPAAPVAPASAIPTAPVNQQAVSHRNDPTVLDEENIGFEDVILPRLNIVQKVGDLSNVFPGGEIVLNQTNSIHAPKTASAPGTGPLIINVLGFRKRQFVEKVEGGEMGLLLNNEADIAKNGGTLDYKEWQNSVAESKANGGKPLKYFQRLATALLLVQKPEGFTDTDHVLFPYPCEDKYYALALWGLKGTGYTNGAKTIFTARKIGHLREIGYAGQQWAVTTKLEKFSSNYAYIPSLTPAAKNTEGFKAFCRDVLGQGN